MPFRGLVALAVPWLVGLAGCATHRSTRATVPAAPEPITIAAPATYSAPSEQAQGLVDVCAVDPAACPNLEREPGSQLDVLQVNQVASADSVQRTPLADAPAVPPAAIPVQPAHAARAEQFDIEAKVRIEVEEIDAARNQLVKLAESFDGQVMNEAVEHGALRRGAALSLRIPSSGVHQFVARLAEVGKVSSSSIETREVSRTLSDAAVVQSNLEHAISRYEELLSKAANVTEATQLEAALMRVRTELSRVKSDIEWSRDRVARSTVYVTLSLPSNSPALEPEAKFYPGLRAALLVDMPSSSSGASTASYAGGGLSLQWGRIFDIDIDFLHALGSAQSSAVDFYVITLGTAFYSDYFGGGRRRTFNPYFGFRAGYAHAPGQNLLPLGGTLGLDLYKSQRLLFACEARAYAMIGREHGPDFAVEPALTLNFAY